MYIHKGLKSLEYLENKMNKWERIKNSYRRKDNSNLEPTCTPLLPLRGQRSQCTVTLWSQSVSIFLFSGYGAVGVNLIIIMLHLQKGPVMIILVE